MCDCCLTTFLVQANSEYLDQWLNCYTILPAQVRFWAAAPILYQRQQSSALESSTARDDCTREDCTMYLLTVLKMMTASQFLTMVSFHRQIEGFPADWKH
jgi:hypothetical protein